MNRKVFFIIALVLTLANLAACAPAPTPAPTAAPPTAAPKPAATQPPAPTAVPPTATAVPKPFRIAVVMPSASNDLAFSQSMFEALGAVQKEMGGKDKLDFVYTDNMVNVPDAAAAIRDYASKGYDLVIAHGSQYGASLSDLANDFPKTAFAWGTAVDTFSSKTKNINAYTVQADQGGYVLGVIAAKLSKSGKFGLIGPIPAGDGKLHIDGFEAGVKATNASATISKTFTQSFSDAALMSQAAQTMSAAGADAFTGTSQAVVGAIAVVKDKNAMWFGNQSEQIKLAEKNVVATQVYDWTPFVKQLIENTKAGKLGGEVMIGTLKNKVLVIKYNPGFTIPADVKKLADDTVQGLIDGKIQTGVK